MIHSDKIPVSGPKEEGSGWSQTLNSGGYLNPCYHFFPKGHRRSICSANQYAAKSPAPESRIPAGARKCKECTTWVQDHPEGGVLYRNTKNRAKDRTKR